jgi:hypothetical protein
MEEDSADMAVERAANQKCNLEFQGAGNSAFFWCAEHDQQLGGASPLPNLMKVKG